ncbi:MAG: class I SAM-dependent methyltransferase [Aquisalimonadaceae bacterium]
MSEHSQRQRWNQRYQGKSPDDQEPAEVLAGHTHLLPRTGRALDVASGLGGNAVFLAAHGLDTVAWDISDHAVSALNHFARSRALPLLAEVRDVEALPPEPGSFDVITVSRFLHRPLCGQLAAALRPGGVIFYQTFTRAKVQGLGPSDPAYLLGDGELLALFSALRPVVYREERDLGETRAGFRDQALLIAFRPA